MHELPRRDTREGAGQPASTLGRSKGRLRVDLLQVHPSPLQRQPRALCHPSTHRAGPHDPRHARRPPSPHQRPAHRRVLRLGHDRQAPSDEAAPASSCPALRSLRLEGLRSVPLRARPPRRRGGGRRAGRRGEEALEAGPLPRARPHGDVAAHSRHQRDLHGADARGTPVRLPRAVAVVVGDALCGVGWRPREAGRLRHLEGRRHGSGLLRGLGPRRAAGGMGREIGRPRRPRRRARKARVGARRASSLRREADLRRHLDRAGICAATATRDAHGFPLGDAWLPLGGTRREWVLAREPAGGRSLGEFSRPGRSWPGWMYRDGAPVLVPAPVPKGASPQNNFWSAT